MDIPPPPPPPEDVPPPPGAGPGSAPPPPPAPSSPYEQGSPYSVPQNPYDGQPPYGAQQPPYGGQQPGYGPNPYQQAGSPYGVPGPYGYPMPSQGWYAVERTTNGLAIASLVTSLSCIPLIGAILGIAALVQIKRRGQRGRGMAIAGVTISGITALIVVGSIILGAVGAFEEGNTKVVDLRTGQCFNTVGSSLRDFGTERGQRTTTVDVLSCAKEHDAEVFEQFSLDPNGDKAYPGTDEVQWQASSRCDGARLQYLNGVPLPDGMEVYLFTPSHDLWDRGNREVTCFFGSPDGKVTGSVGNSFDPPGGSGDSSDGGSDGISDGGADDSGGVGV